MSCKYVKFKMIILKQNCLFSLIGDYFVYLHMRVFQHCTTSKQEVVLFLGKNYIFYKAIICAFALSITD